MTPSLLYLSDCGERMLAADAVFDDLQLGFLPAPVRNVLRVGATGEEIAARQAIFRLLDEAPETAELLRCISTALFMCRSEQRFRTVRRVHSMV